MKNTKNCYLMLGYAVPDHVFDTVNKTESYPQVQTHKYIWNFINAIESISDLDVDYISTSPVSDYPNNRKIFFKGGSHTRILNCKKVRIFEIPFINFSFLKLLSRFSTFFIFSFFHLIKKKRRGIIVYSVSVPLMLSGYFLSRVFGIKLIGIWTDPPSVPSSRDSKIKNSLRTIELQISLFLMKKFSKVFVVTEHLAKDFSPSSKYLVLDGFSSNNVNVKYSKTFSHNKYDLITFLYSGTLDKKYGIDKFCFAFNKLEFKNVKLVVYGTGDYQENIIKLSFDDPRVEYRGFAPNEEVIREQASASFLVNFRSPYDDYVKYTFPSKTLEYLASGTPLLTTILPSFSLAYLDAVIGVENNDVNSLFHKMNFLIKSYPSGDLKSISENALKLAASKTSSRWAERIYLFLSQDADN